MTSSLGEILSQLSLAVGYHFQDVRDEHERWAVYRQSMESPQNYDLLLEAVSLEEDVILASSVVLQMLEHVEASEGDIWVQQLPENQRAFAATRLKELNNLKNINLGVVNAAFVESQIADWTPWLQRRIAEDVKNKEILHVLKGLGKTKRIRNLAANKISEIKD